uniref:SUEL-type lectin domain-containing protein n=1 Tax=Oreochromis niloticus TaxID=8128 RepID=A0A669E3G9_ORENI
MKERLVSSTGLTTGAAIRPLALRVAQPTRSRTPNAPIPPLKWLTGSQANLHCGENTFHTVVSLMYCTCSYQRPECEVQNAQCANPTSKVADSCNGKSSCTIEASNTEFGDPCPGTYKYLEVAYDCPCDITCEHSYANLHCGHVIVVLSAEYGRNDSTMCSYKRPPAQPKNTQCSISTSKVAESCNSRNSCSIKVRNSVFGDPCPGTYKYLDVVYDCEIKYLKDPFELFRSLSISVSNISERADTRKPKIMCTKLHVDTSKLAYFSVDAT